GRATGRTVDDDAHRPRRIGLRPRDARATLIGRGRGRRPSQPPLGCAIPSCCLFIGRISTVILSRDGWRKREERRWKCELFGRTGMQLSVLGFGCGAVGGLMVRGDPLDQERTIGRAIAAGVNYFDTAVQYGNGESEKNSQRGGRCEGRIERPVYS